ncbi:PhoH family protein [Candidatus Dependentiae bacterium]
MEAKKIYLLDTNVLVYDPGALFVFEGALVAIPIIVLEELDKFKRENTDRGRNARQATRYLDELRKKGPLGQGVELDNGSTLKVLFIDKSKVDLCTPFKEETADNEILAIGCALRDQGNIVRFISKDINARVKADVLGLEAQDYLKDAVTKDEFYKGWVRVGVPAVQLKREFPEILRQLVEDKALEINQFVLVESQHNPFNNKLFRYIGSKKFIHVEHPKFAWPLKARNPQQLMALNLMLDPSIQMVSLLGKAGSGKTFLALLAGLQQVLADESYKKILVSRPVVPLGRDIGYLPGDVQEKLYSWMLPIYDNIELILHHATLGKHLGEIRREQKDKKHDKKKHKDEKHKLGHVDELIRRKKLSMEAITYMRGRSIPYQFILIDEVQNLTPHEIKTLITRVGEGSKIVIAGDPYQIDSPYLDFSSNGLVLSSERFKGQPIFGSVYLETSERSELSELANKLL